MMRVPKRLKEQSPSHARAKVQEKKLAERIGGTTTKASGASYEKGDVRIRSVARVECKTTKNRSFSISVNLLDKLDAAVFGTNEIPFFEVELLLGARKAVVMTGDALDMLIEQLKLCRHG